MLVVRTCGGGECSERRMAGRGDNTRPNEVLKREERAGKGEEVGTAGSRGKKGAAEEVVKERRGIERTGGRRMG